MLVGLSRDIICTTHISVTKMEWILVGVTEPVEKEEDGRQSLILPLEPTNTGLDGARFTCRITTVKGKIFEQTVTVEVKGKFENYTVGEVFWEDCEISYFPQ